MFSRTYLHCFTAIVLLCCACTVLQAQSVKNPPNEIRENRQLLEKSASAAGLKKSDIPDAIINDLYTDAVTGITYLYVQQGYQGIRVHNSIVSIAMKHGVLVSHSGDFVPDLKGKIRTATASRTPVDAVRAAVTHLKLRDRGDFATTEDNFSKTKSYKVSRSGIAKTDIVTTLVYLPSADKKSVRLVWNVNIDVEGSDDWWNVRIDASSGEFVEKDNQTVYEHQADGHDHDNSLPPSAETPNHAIPGGYPAPQPPTGEAPPNVTSATYRVVPFPFESPLASGFVNSTNPWSLAGAGNNATTHGWHFDGTNNYTVTRGNNVFAFLDRANDNNPNPTNNWPDTSTTAAPSLSFQNVFQPTLQPSLDGSSKKAALTNLFYWTNLSHDITYQYGFTEQAGNFQADNIGRGGIQNDYVMANAQDNAGYNNANFGTGADGSVGRMQMYLWSGPLTLNMTAPVSMTNVAALQNSFGSPNKLVEVGPLSGQVVQYDSVAPYINGCLASRDPARIAGKIVLITAAGCSTYLQKIKNAQNAGAIGVLIYHSFLVGMSGDDPTVVIPVLAVTNTFANTIISYTSQGIPVTVYMNEGIRKDGDFDNSIIVHEFGHGVSTRLTGGPSTGSCLFNVEQAGEGWSDYLALMTTTDWANTPLTAGANPRTIGNYALDQASNGPGIRRYPYSTNMGVNPLTYASMVSNQQVHAIGEIWCSAVWDMTWNIIQQTNLIEPDIYNAASARGNTIAMNLVMTALKLQPCSPGFLDSRDAILRADSILYNYEHKCAIWNAFARRGMGYSARQGSSNNTADQTAAYDVPTGLRMVGANNVLQFPLSAQPTIRHTVSCDCAALANQVIRDTLPAGLTFVSSIPAGATVSGNVVSFPATSFAANETKTFSLRVETAAIGCAPVEQINDNRDGSTTGNLVSNSPTGWVSSTAFSKSPANSWYSHSDEFTAQYTLTSPLLTPAAGSNLNIFSFWHYYNTETQYDGGVVEYSVNGSTWLDAAPFFVTGKYPAGLINGTGRPGFSGTNSFFEKVVVDLSSLGSTPVQLRFRSISDESSSVDGWYVDDILKADGCGGILKSGLYDASGNLLQSSATPVFLNPGAVLPVTWVDFTAIGQDKVVQLQWKVTNEVNVSHYEVEHSATGRNFVKLSDIPVSSSNSSDKTYSQVDRTPVAGNNYYRIRQVDIDGNSSYTGVRLVRMEQAGDISVWPNPVQSVTRIQSPSVIKSIQVYNAAGKVILNANPSVKTYNINLAKFPAGVYSVRIETADKVVTQKLVKQ
ncbi:MAG: T9SS type A sorting domain-containing protein [Chitinophagaceae bacterium]|nr:MAG: T9SS type A sorting domain-containing protein [Chitinophagaceae bacterium]